MRGSFLHPVLCSSNVSSDCVHPSQILSSYMLAICKPNGRILGQCSQRPSPLTLLTPEKKVRKCFLSPQNVTIAYLAYNVRHEAVFKSAVDTINARELSWNVATPPCALAISMPLQPFSNTHASSHANVSPSCADASSCPDRPSRTCAHLLERSSESASGPVVAMDSSPETRACCQTLPCCTTADC